MGIGVCVCVAGSLISIMPKYMSVPLSASASAHALPGCLSVRCHPVWSAARPCQNFHLQSTRPTHRHSHTQTHTHTVRLRGAYDIQIRQGAIPSPKHQTPTPSLTPFPLLLFHFPEPELCLPASPCRCLWLGGYTCATMCVCVWRNFLIYFLANGSRPLTFQVRVLPTPNKLLMEISKYWFSVKTFPLSLSLSTHNWHLNCTNLDVSARMTINGQGRR